MQRSCTAETTKVNGGSEGGIPRLLGFACLFDVVLLVGPTKDMTCLERVHVKNWSFLNHPTCDLTGLSDPFG